MCARCFVRSRCHVECAPPPRARRLANNPSSDGIEHDLRGTVEIEFLHDMRAMRFHGAWADVQQRRDLLVRLGFSDQLKDFALALGEDFESIRDALVAQLATIVIEHHTRNGWTEEG